jgi:hypothetical protein
MIILWQSLALLSIGLWIGAITVLIVLKFGTQPRVQVARANCVQPIHWVPTKQAGGLLLRLRSKGFIVLNVGSVNGMTLLAVYEVTW